MCFNISIVSTQAIIEKQFDAEFHINFSFEPKHHISAFSNPKIPVITSEQPQIIQPSYWGLIPHWIQDISRAEKIRKMTYNAKSETIKEKHHQFLIKNRSLLYNSKATRTSFS